jgi:Trypsin/PEP-CTERM motif
MGVAMVEFRCFAQASVAALLLAGAAGAQAQAKFNAANWTAAHEIVGQTSTATVAAGGNPLYIPPRPQYNSTVGILMNYGAAGNFVCSGTLINSTAVVTAAHCVSSATRGAPISTTVFFTNRTDDPNVYAGGAGIDQRAVSSIVVNPLYTQTVVDQNDIAILKLTTAAPSYVKAAKLSGLSDLTGLDHIIAGYGVRSDTGGSIGSNLGTGRLRYAGNRFDFRFGDSDFEGYFDGAFPADASNVWISDFDNGTAFRDGSCNVPIFEGPSAPAIFSKAVFSSSKYCDLGRGAFEGIGGGGDSGGSYFVDGKLAAVHSFALWYRGDESNNRFGQLKGAVSIDFHRSFITTNAGAIPEPSSWALLIAGFGLTGATMRRRRAVAA